MEKTQSKRLEMNGRVFNSGQGRHFRFVINMLKVLLLICSFTWHVNIYVSRQGEGINRGNEGTEYIYTFQLLLWITLCIYVNCSWLKLVHRHLLYPNFPTRVKKDNSVSITVNCSQWQLWQIRKTQIPVFCFNSWEDNCFFSVQLLYGLGLLVLLSTSGEDTGVLFSLAQRSIYCRLLRGCFDGFIYFMDSLSSCSFQPRFITVDSCVPWYALYLERRDEATHVVEVHSHWYFILCTGKLWQTLKSVQEGCRVTADVDTVAACLRSLRANAPWSKGQLRPFHRLKIDWIDTKIYVLIYFFI